MAKRINVYATGTGTFTITVDSLTTAPITVGASAETVHDALEAILGTDTVEVSATSITGAIKATTIQNPIIWNATGGPSWLSGSYTGGDRIGGGGQVWVASNSGNTGENEPSWFGTYVTDNEIIWVPVDSWQASHAYTIGDMVQPTSPNGYYYTAGKTWTSYFAEPTWLAGDTTEGTAAFGDGFYSGQSAIEMFDGVLGDKGIEAAGHFGYVFNPAITPTAYSWRLGSYNTAQDPLSWTLQGYNEGISEWVDLDTHVDEPYGTASDFKTYSFSNTTSFVNLRILVTAVRSSAYFVIDELWLGESTGTVGARYTITFVSEPTAVTCNVSSATFQDGEAWAIVSDVSNDAPGDVTGLTCSTTNLGNITLAWNEADNATGYNVARRVLGTGSFVEIGNSGNVTVTAFIDYPQTGIDLGYQVTPVNRSIAGNASDEVRGLRQTDLSLIPGPGNVAFGVPCYTADGTGSTTGNFTGNGSGSGGGLSRSRLQLGM